MLTAVVLLPATWPKLEGAVLTLCGYFSLGNQSSFPFCSQFFPQTQKDSSLCMPSVFFFGQKPVMLTTCLQESVRGTGIRKERWVRSGNNRDTE